MVHHRNPVGHGQRFFLIVRHEHKGNTDPGLQGFEFELHLFAQLLVQCTEGFIQQEHFGLIDQGASQGDSLLLATRELFGFAVGHRRQAHQVEHLLHPAIDLRARHPAHFQAKRHVLGHGHVRKESIALKNRIDRALKWWQLTHLVPVDKYLPGGGQVEAGNHAQGGRLAAAARPQHRKKFTIEDLHGDIVHSNDLAGLAG